MKKKKPTNEIQAKWKTLPSCLILEKFYFDFLQEEYINFGIQPFQQTIRKWYSIHNLVENKSEL